ncbi:MAG: elongation factor G [Pseudomonadota bacterium]
MARYKPEDIRNVVFAGHGGTGKTSFVDELLFASKANTRIGSVRDGSSLSDFLEDEIDAQASIDLSMLYCNYQGTHFQLFDAPGRSDFLGQMTEGLYAADIVAIFVDGYSGLQVNTKRAWRMATKEGKARVVVLSKCDVENVDLEKVINDIRETFGQQCVPFNLPDKTGGGISRMLSVLKPADDASDLVKLFHEPLIESVVESDEELMMRYLDGEDVSADIGKQLSVAIAEGTVVPILCTAQTGSLGVTEFLDTIKAYFPSPAATTTVKALVSGTDEDGEPVQRVEEMDLPEEEFIGQVVRIIIDDHKGRMAILRLLSGNLASGMNYKNPSTGKGGRLGKLAKIFGGRHDDVDSVGKGEIFAAIKIEDLYLGETITGGKWTHPVAPHVFPVPMVALACRPKTRSDEQKLSQVLNRFISEDPCFRTEVDRMTKEMIIYGLSDLHLNTILSRMAKKYKVEVFTKLPKISYRETITRSVSDSYRHKKQSGGSGEFAEVHLRLTPWAEENFVFVDALRGDNVRRQFVPSVEKGCKSTMEAGILTGSPVIQIKAEFFDGKDHPVDGKDSAFQKAASMCFKKVFLAASPVLLEPIVDLEIVFPSNYSGEVNQFINGHRGRIQGMDSSGSDQVLRASVPLAECQTFSTDLRSMTQGQGSFTMSPKGFEHVPPQLQQQVIDLWQKDQAGDGD